MAVRWIGDSLHIEGVSYTRIVLRIMMGASKA
jgi:hypothetical protein